MAMQRNMRGDPGLITRLRPGAHGGAGRWEQILPWGSGRGPRGASLRPRAPLPTLPSCEALNEHGCVTFISSNKDAIKVWVGA